MVTIGTPKSATATKVVLCGSGELGKEFVIELQRYGVEVIALDKYPDAPMIDTISPFSISRSIPFKTCSGAPLKYVLFIPFS